MKTLERIAYAIAVVAFGAVGIGTTDVPLLRAESSGCDPSGSGEKCGERVSCLEYETTTIEIFGATRTCKVTETIFLYKSDPPPAPPGGSTGGGTGGGGGSGFGDPDNDSCGDPDLWSDDGSNCDRDSQQMS
jgi:hypothetical protein